MTPIEVGAFVLLVAGVVGSLYPRVPGAVFSLAGVGLYWWGSGYTEPETTTVALLALVAGLVLVGRAFRRYIAPRVGSASTLTATVGGAVGAVLFTLVGTTGLVLGTVLTVFVLEYVRRRDAKGSFVAALAVVFGTFASRVARVLLMGLVLVVMLAVAFA